jgi:hypothetical protein
MVRLDFDNKRHKNPDLQFVGAKIAHQAYVNIARSMIDSTCFGRIASAKNIG